MSSSRDRLAARTSGVQDIAQRVEDGCERAEENDERDDARVEQCLGTEHVRELQRREKDGALI